MKLITDSVDVSMIRAGDWYTKHECFHSLNI